MRSSRQVRIVGAVAATMGVLGCAAGLEPTPGGNGGAPTTDAASTSGVGGAPLTSGNGTSATSTTVGAGAGTSTSTSTTTTTGATSTAATTTAAASSSSTTTSSSGTTVCSPQPTVAAGALDCPNDLCTFGTPAVSGYAFGYGDPGPTTTFCVATNAACMKGTLTPANPPTYSYYGAGLGLNLGPAVGTAMPTPVQLGGTGISITLSNLPPGGARLQVSVGGTAYCAALTSASATIPWASFNTKCYDSPPDGVALTAAPATPNVQVALPSGTSELSYDFCVTSLAITT